MNNYYTLKINNSFDIVSHYIANEEITLIPNIIFKKIDNLILLEKYFMELDDKIEKDNDFTYKIYGSFPVIGVEQNNKIYDLITGKLITRSNKPKEVNGLSYNHKYVIDKQILNILLKLLYDDRIIKYINYINNIEGYSKALFYGAIPKDKYYMIKLNNISPDSDYIIAKEINNNYIEIFTKEKIYNKPNNVITKNISYRNITSILKTDAIIYIDKIIDYNYQNYLKIINNAKSNSVNAYHNYINKNKVLIKR